MPSQKPFPKLFLALDISLQDANFSKITEALKNNPEVGLKVHSILDEAFLSGRFQDLKAMSGHLWYDAKLADIPSTLQKRILALSQDFDSITLNLEAVGLEGAVASSQIRDEIFEKTGKYINLIGVTVLTSKDPKKYMQQFGIDMNLVIKNLIQVAIETNLDGLVCSPLEAAMAKDLIQKNNSEIKIITPGIKPHWAVANQAQNRTATPSQAMQNGADSLVVGTAILKAENPDAAIKRVLEEV